MGFENSIEKMPDVRGVYEKMPCLACKKGYIEVAKTKDGKYVVKKRCPVCGGTKIAL